MNGKRDALRRFKDVLREILGEFGQKPRIKNYAVRYYRGGR